MKCVNDLLDLSWVRRVLCGDVSGQKKKCRCVCMSRLHGFFYSGRQVQLRVLRLLTWKSDLILLVVTVMLSSRIRHLKMIGNQ